MTRRKKQTRTTPHMTYVQVRELFNYDPTTGILTWNNDGHGHIKGSEVVTTDRTCLSWNTMKLRRTKVIWLWMTGEDAPSPICRQDKDHSNYKWDNLSLIQTARTYRKRASAGIHENCAAHIVVEYPPLQRNQNIHRHGRGHIVITPHVPVYNMGDPPPFRSALFQKTGRI